MATYALNVYRFRNDRHATYRKYVCNLWEHISQSKPEWTYDKAIKYIMAFVPVSKQDIGEVVDDYLETKEA